MFQYFQQFGPHKYSIYLCEVHAVLLLYLTSVYHSLHGSIFVSDFINIKYAESKYLS